MNIQMLRASHDIRDILQNRDIKRAIQMAHALKTE
jgi:hypothetical protein